MSSRSSSLARMPVSVLGCTCISIASSPGEMPGNSPMSRRANRWGPVTPRPRSMRFEVRCRWWSSAHSSCMNCKTSGRTSPSSNGGRVDRPRRVVGERRGLTDVMTATRRHRDCRPHLLYRSSLAPSAVHGPPRDGRNRQPFSAAEQEQGEEPHDSSSDRKPCDTLRSCPRLQGSAAATQQAPSAPLTPADTPSARKRRAVVLRASRAPGLPGSVFGSRAYPGVASAQLSTAEPGVWMLRSRWVDRGRAVVSQLRATPAREVRPCAEHM